MDNKINEQKEGGENKKGGIFRKIRQASDAGLVWDNYPEVLSLMGFFLFFAWILSFPFEGQVLYSLCEKMQLDPYFLVFGSIVAHFAGLFSCGFFLKSIKDAKRLILFSIAYCLVATFIFFLPFSFLWSFFLFSASYLAGTSVAAWGFYLRAFSPSNERIKTVADVLIYSNIFMIMINVVAVNLSAEAGLALCMLLLVAAFLFVLRIIPAGSEKYVAASAENISTVKNPWQPLVFLCVFIIVITVNSGLMYQVINPAFAHHTFLASWYWAVPYIIALYVVRNLPRNASRAYILYVAIAMIGFAFIFFMILDRSALSYVVIDTLMLGACGVCDLFWWSILAEMLDYYDNPAQIFGIGLSANVLGVLLGGLLGNRITSNAYPYNPSVLAVFIVFVTLLILPLLYKRLSTLLQNHVFLTTLATMPAAEQKETIREFMDLGQLTEREKEIASLLLKGRTYKMIASELYLSENTVKTHIKNIYAKYNVKNKAELINLLTEQEPFQDNILTFK